MILQPRVQQTRSNQSPAITGSRVLQPRVTQPLTIQKQTVVKPTATPMPSVVKITPTQKNIFETVKDKAQELIKVGQSTISFVQPKQQNIVSPVPKQQTLVPQKQTAPQVIKITPNQKRIDPIQMQQGMSSAQFKTRTTDDIGGVFSRIVDKAIKVTSGPYTLGTDIRNYLKESGEQVADIPSAIKSYYAKDKTYKPKDLSPSAKRGLDFLAGAAMGGNVQMGAVAGNEAFILGQATTKLTKNVSEASVGGRTYFFSPKEVQRVVIGKDQGIAKEILSNAGLTSEQWRIAVKNGTKIEIPADKVITMIDKPWFAKLKSLIGKSSSKSETIVSGGKTKVDNIAGLLGDGEHTPQQVIGTVIKSGKANTEEGKTLVKTAMQAQQRGENIVISTKSEVVQKFDQNIQDYRSYGGYTAGTRVENAALRDIASNADKTEVKAYTQEKIKNALESGELQTNKDGTITLYRGGEPSKTNALVSATYDKTVAEQFAKKNNTTIKEFQVKPEDIQAFIGKAEKEVLVKNETVQAGLSEVKGIKLRNESNYPLGSAAAYFGNEKYFSNQELKGAYGKYKYEIDLPKDAKIINLDKKTPEAIKFIDEILGEEYRDRSYEIKKQLFDDEWAIKENIVRSIKKFGYEGATWSDEYILPKDTINKYKSVAEPSTSNVKPEVKEQTVSVPRQQLPQGAGETKVSRLEARVQQAVDNLSQETIDKLGLSTYKELSKKENIKAAAEYVANNPEDAIRVLTGEIEAPKGLLRNAIYLAMEKASGENVGLARKLATLTSTRLGQEISILTELDKNSPVKIMSDIYKIKEEAIRKRTGKNISKVVDDTVSEIKKKVKTPNKYDWNSFIESIQC